MSACDVIVSSAATLPLWPEFPNSVQNYETFCNNICDKHMPSKFIFWLEMTISILGLTHKVFDETFHVHIWIRFSLI